MSLTTAYIDYISGGIQDPHTWMGVLGVAAFAAFLTHILWLREPRCLERAMARKLERKRVADIVSAALQDACHNKEISSKEWHKYNKKLAYSLGLPDMIPREQRRPEVVKLFVRRRLDAMGVNIADGLKIMRRNRPSKKDKVLASLKHKS